MSAAPAPPRPAAGHTGRGDQRGPGRGRTGRGRSGRGRTGRGRAIPLTFGTATTALVVLTLALALSTPPPSTPPIGAVAPQVREQVEVERLEQSSRFGAGAGDAGDCVGEGCGAPAAAEGTVAATAPAAGTQPTAGPTDPAAGQPVPTRRCVIGPGGPRQTEDPQSPPCKPEIFQGDNGGSTWTGVTATEIRIGYPLGPSSPYGSNNDNQRLFPAWLEHFNRYYEFYGRKLVFVPVEVQNQDDPAVQRSDAQAIAAADVFAALSYRRFGVHQAELARLGVVHTVDNYRAGMPSRDQLLRSGPYTWAVYPTLDENLEATGELVCRALAGRPARHGGEEVADRTRRFGVLVQQPGPLGLTYDDSILLRRLEACGADHRRYPVHHDDVDAQGLMNRIRADGVTTVVCVCDDLEDVYLVAAEDAGFRPEWLLPGIDDHSVMLKDRRIKRDERPREQLAHVFGLWSGPRRPPVDGVGRRYRVHDEYWFRAAKAEDPTVFEPTNEYPYGWYAQLLLLASGIQWAGPDLTPETFAAALAGLRYPNPGVGAPPWYQASVGFGARDHAFLSDHALFWWRDPTDAGHESRTDMGEVCFVGGGTRFSADTIPADADERFFDPQAGCR